MILVFGSKKWGQRSFLYPKCQWVKPPLITGDHSGMVGIFKANDITAVRLKF